MARKKARKAAKERIKRTARESSEISTFPFLLSPVTRPFAAPIRRVFPATVDAIVDSGLLDDAIDAKVAELAGQRGIPMGPLAQERMPMTREEQVMALVEVAKTLGTDPEIVEETENLISAASPSRGPRFSESIRRQFNRANLLMGIVADNEPIKKTRKKTKTDKNMSKALAQANSELRKKNGELRKGVTQADVMRRAHRIRRKMS